MKISISVDSRFASLFFIIIFSTLFSLSVPAQDLESRRDKIFSPAEEDFADADAVVSPWRVGKCPIGFYKITDCHKVDAGNWNERRHTSIYNEDGSLWYVYSNQSDEPDYYKRSNKTMDFLPFAGVGDYGRDAILRMVGESEHWYKVMVNEKTQASKFILKSDPNWEKTSWDFWLARIEYFAVNENDKTEIYDKPEGSVVGRTDALRIDHFDYLGKRDGDWVLIEASKSKGVCNPSKSKSENCHSGWIRWREGRKFLIKSDSNFFVFNDSIDMKF